MNLKKWVIVVLLSVFMPMVAMADDGDTNSPKKDAFSEGIGDAAKMMGDTMTQAGYIVRYGAVALTFAFAVGGYFMGSNYVKRKQEQNQGNEAPQLIRIGIPIASAMMGLAVVFVVIGLFGKIFLGSGSMTEAWEDLVTNTTKSFFKPIGGDTGGGSAQPAAGN